MKRFVAGMIGTAMIMAPTLAQASTASLNRPAGELGLRDAVLAQDDTAGGGSAAGDAAVGGGGLAWEAFLVGGLAIAAVATGLIFALDNDDDDRPVST